MAHFFSTRCFQLAGLLLLASITITPAAWATPTQTSPVEQTDTTLNADHGPAEPSADSTANDMVGEHHPRNDLGGSYSLNTPARSGFWVAASFTGVVGFALLVTLVLFRPEKHK